MVTRSKLTTFLACSLILAFALITAALAADAADSAAIKGTWKVSFDMQGQPVEATLEIKDAEGGGLTGTWTSPRGTDALKDVKWDGTELTFSRTVNRQGQDIAITHTAKINGDTLEGKMVLPQREIPFTGKKAS